MPRKSGGTRRKRRTHKVPNESKEVDKTPRSFVFRRGNVPSAIRDLVPDLRTMLMPHTAVRLKERKTNSIRDYVSIATQVGVSHFWILSATSRSPYLRIGRLPQGATLTFRVAEYSLAVDVRTMQRRPLLLHDNDFAEPPLLVLNNFVNAGSEVALMAETFRHSFPPIDVNSARLSTLRRVLLIHRDTESGRLYIRHYALKVQQAGLSRPVRKMVTKRRIPKMAGLADVSQLMDGAPGVFSSDSEPEDNPDAMVTLAQSVSKLKRGASSTIKLVEVGPRLTLDLVKVQSGLCDGAVIYHSFVEKTEEEARETERRLAERKNLKRKRREMQEVNVKRKEDLKRAKKDRRKKNADDRLEAIKVEEESDAESHSSNDKPEQSVVNGTASNPSRSDEDP